MAWALQFDGGNDYATLNSAVSFANTGEYSIRIAVKLDAVPSNDINSLLYLDSNNYLYYRQSNARFYWKIAGSNVQLPVPTVDVLGIDVVVHLQQTAAGVKTITVDGIGTGNPFTGLRTFSFDRFVRTGNWEFEGQLSEVVVYSDIAETTAIERWSATDSSHTAGTPVLLNTITGNNATGVNMPTDGSAWLDLGGGSLTITPTFLVSTLTFHSPTVLQAKLLTPNTIASTLNLQDPTVLKAKRIDLDTISSTLVPQDPTILQSKIISLDTITSTLSIQDPTLLKSLLITPEFITSNTSVWKPALTGGIVVVIGASSFRLQIQWQGINRI
jgi:hypothetical protein